MSLLPLSPHSLQPSASSPLRVNQRCPLLPPGPLSYLLNWIESFGTARMTFLTHFESSTMLNTEYVLAKVATELSQVAGHATYLVVTCFLCSSSIPHPGTFSPTSKKLHPATDSSKWNKIKLWLVLFWRSHALRKKNRAWKCCQLHYRLRSQPRGRAVESWRRSGLMSKTPPVAHLIPPTHVVFSEATRWGKSFLSSLIFQKQYATTNFSSFLTLWGRLFPRTK